MGYPAGTTVFHYDLMGNIIGESDAAGNFRLTSVYLGSQRLASFETAAAVTTDQVSNLLKKMAQAPSAGEDVPADLDRDGRLGMGDAVAGLERIDGLRPSTDVLAYYYINDHLGTPRKVVNSQGHVVWQGTYRPFGEVVAGGTRVFDNKFRFPGQYLDDATGLHYNYHRYYHPGIGRYLNADPIGLAGGINPFSYTNSNSISSVDEQGLWPTQSGLYVHHRAIYVMIGKNIDRNDHLALVEGQVIADSDAFQGTEFAFRHAMRGINPKTGTEQTVSEARMMANAFIRNQFSLAWRLKKQGRAYESLVQFSIGLHTLQDWTAPPHHGFQLWTGKENWWEILNHIAGEAFNPGYGSELYRITKDAWGWYQKGELPCGDLFEEYGSDIQYALTPDTF